MTDVNQTTPECFSISSLTDLYRSVQATESHALSMMRVQRGITSWGSRRTTDRRTEGFTVFLDAPDNASRITVKTEFVLNAAKTGLIRPMIWWWKRVNIQAGMRAGIASRLPARSVNCGLMLVVKIMPLHFASCGSCFTRRQKLTSPEILPVTPPGLCSDKPRAW